MKPPEHQSWLLLGPRGVGKTAWLRATLPEALFFDLLEARTYQELLAAPGRLGARIPERFEGWVVVDEVQRVPELLNEVHRLIEGRLLRFVLTGSSVRLIHGGSEHGHDSGVDILPATQALPLLADLLLPPG